MDKIKIIFDKMGITDDYNEDTKLDLLGFNSLAILELIVEIEEYYDIVIEETDLEMENFDTVSTVCKLIEKYTEKQGKHYYEKEEIILLYVL